MDFILEYWELFVMALGGLIIYCGGLLLKRAGRKADEAHGADKDDAGCGDAFGGIILCIIGLAVCVVGIIALVS